jgi:ribosomal protein L40E
VVVIRCPSCSTINPLSADKCLRCSTDLRSLETIKNPYI